MPRLFDPNDAPPPPPVAEFDDAPPPPPPTALDDLDDAPPPPPLAIDLDDVPPPPGNHLDLVADDEAHEGAVVTNKRKKLIGLLGLAATIALGAVFFGIPGVGATSEAGAAEASETTEVEGRPLLGAA